MGSGTVKISQLRGVNEVRDFKRLNIYLSCIFLISFILLTFGVSLSDEIKVATTIAPYRYFIEKIGAGIVKVTVLVPPGADPHSYEPKPSVIKEVSGAEVYVKAGVPLEFEINWADKIISLNKKIFVINSSNGIKLINNDPHVWLSPKNAIIISKNICEGMCKYDSSNKKSYEKNYDKLKKELTELDLKIKNILKNKKNSRFLVFHPAWLYFANEFGLEEIAIEKEGKEPTLRDLNQLLKDAKKNNIKIVVVSPEVSKKTATLMAKELNASVYVSNHLSVNYQQSLMELSEALSK